MDQKLLALFEHWQDVKSFVHIRNPFNPNKIIRALLYLEECTPSQASIGIDLSADGPSIWHIMGIVFRFCKPCLEFPMNIGSQEMIGMLLKACWIEGQHGI